MSASTFNLSDLKLETVNGKTFIKLPNGDVLEFTLLDSALMIDLRSNVGGESVDALKIPSLPHLQWSWNNLGRGETPNWTDFDGFIFHPVSKSVDEKGNEVFERMTSVVDDGDVHAWTVYGCVADENDGSEIALHDCASEAEARVLINYCNVELRHSLVDKANQEILEEAKKNAVSKILQLMDSDEDAPDNLSRFVADAAREFNISVDDIQSELDKHI